MSESHHGSGGMADEWLPVETLPPLGEDEVQIWRVDLPDEGTPPEDYIGLLSPEERARTERLRAGMVRLQFVVARAVLRTLLGNCLATDPRNVAITPTSFGKPETPGVFFNVAHSGTAVLIALCRLHRVGIDVEFSTRKVDPLGIAKHSFSVKEQRALSSIADPDDLRRAFFRCWTRKEAVIKADGRGLSLPLHSFEVPVDGQAESAYVIIADLSGSEICSYFLSDLTWDGEAVAAFAVAACCCAARKFIFPLGAMAQKA